MGIQRPNRSSGRCPNLKTESAPSSQRWPRLRPISVAASSHGAQHLCLNTTTHFIGFGGLGCVFVRDSYARIHRMQAQVMAGYYNPPVCALHNLSSVWICLNNWTQKMYIQRYIGSDVSVRTGRHECRGLFDTVQTRAVQIMSLECRALGFSHVQ